ncbi:MAG: hypothetical protein A2033_01310, partial [Bacteroidetes bacterium GWA2_31_9]
MKRINFLLVFLIFTFIFSITVNISYSQVNNEPVKPTEVKTGVFLGETPALRSLPKINDWEAFEKNRVEKKKERKKIIMELEPERNPGLRNRSYPFADIAYPKGEDPIWQKANKNAKAAPILVQNFAGPNSSSLPPDCNGAVGPNHYVQTINTTYSIYSKTGALLAGPTNLNLVFGSVTGSSCNDGDPIVLYDEFADRWFFAEFSLCGADDYMLMAVSTTNDPTGTWYAYSFNVDDTPDYMKFGIWQDGYYMATNNGTAGRKDVYVFQRDVMLAGGASPKMVGFDNSWRPTTIDGFHCIMPLDNDITFAPTGTPGMFITINDDAVGGGSDQIWFYQLDVDWTTTANSTFTRTQQLNVPAFDSNFGTDWANIAQPGTTQQIDAIPQIFMFRAQYINFGGYQTIVCTHSVDVDNTDHAGVRWYELRSTGGTWSVRQSGTYAPDANSRWMAGISMNVKNEIAIGYSISSSSVYPGIRFAGQSAQENANALGVFDITETVIKDGTASQTSADRWGDYAQMSIDPSDNETFWFTTEYGRTAPSTKGTQIAAFRFPDLALPPTPDFTASQNTFFPTGIVNFNDLSTGVVTNWSWSFPGGSPNSSTIQNPTGISYSTPGQYQVSLTATNTNGSATETKTAYIKVLNPAVASCDTLSHFTGTPAMYFADGTLPHDTGYISGTNAYNDLAKAEMFDYYSPYQEIDGADFYFGVAYGTSNVTFNVWGDNGGKPGSVLGTVTVPMATIITDMNAGNPTHVDFTPNVVIPGTPVYIGVVIPTGTDSLVLLTNSNGEAILDNAWEQWSSGSWHTYTDAWGVTVNNAIFAHVCTNPTLAPTAEFSANQVEFMAPGTVNFTDESWGGIATSWSWSFSGGSPATSSLQNPTGIIYSTPGTFDVTLTSTNANGSDAEVKTGYINVLDPNASNCDTLNNLVGGLALYTIPSPNSGYVCGNNSYGDLQKAEYFATYSPYTKIDGAYFAFSVCKDAGAASNLTIRVYNNTGTAGAPGAIIATQTVPYSTIINDISNGDLTYVQFATPVTIPGPFYISILLPTTAGDTVAVYSDAQNANATNTAWEQWSDNVWYDFASAWGGNFNLAIMPIVCTDGSPLTDFYASTDSICVGSTVNYFDASTGWPTSYSWTFAGGTPSTSNVENPSITYNTVGSYSVTHTSTNAQGTGSKTKTNYITVVNPPTVTFSQTNENPSGVCNGSATANGVGISPFTYQWSISSTGSSLFNGTTGTVTNNTTKDFTATVSGLGVLDNSLYTLDKVCITVSTTRLQDLDISLLSPSSAIITLTDDNGTGTGSYTNTCFKQSAATAITAGTTPYTGDFRPEVTMTTFDGVNANGTWILRIRDDQATASTPNLTSWTMYFNYNLPQTSQSISSLCAGTYTVTATDGIGCSGTGSVTITNSVALSASISAQTNVSCNGGSDGTATVTASGGTSPYNYAWPASAGSQTNATATNLTAGTYTVTVSDATPSTATATVTITEPASALTASIGSQTDVLCFGNNTGSATVTASGGTGTLTYLWSGGGTSATKNSLIAGTYTVTVTDANSCTATASATITQPAAALSASITAQTNVLCNGGNTGSATVTVSGGTSAYSYNWAGTPTGDLTATITGLVAGNYAVTITDANSCTATTTATITQPASALSVTIAKTNVLCNGNSTGSATATPSGGTGISTYSWTGGATTASISGLIAGTYTVTATDANNCTATATTTITQPASALALALASQTNVLCKGNSTGAIDITPSGGTPIYTYSWTGPSAYTSTNQDLTTRPAGAYAVTVTDANACTINGAYTITEPATVVSVSISKTDVLCNGQITGSATATGTGGTGLIGYIWTGGATTASITNKPAGIYSVTATDASGCTATATTTITQPATALSVSISKTDVDCFGNSTGAAMATGTGGTGAIGYFWTGGATTASITNKLAGIYTVTATDANGCTATATTTITQPASALSVSISKTDVACFGNSTGTATATPSGGTGISTYSWTGGSTTASITNKPAGTYSVTITDANSCTATATTTITEPASALSVSISKTDVLCFGNSTGSATATPSGGTGTSTYSWTGGATTASITNKPAGTYSVTITDANLCTATATTTIAQPASGLTVSISKTDVACFGNSTGSATATPAGGTGISTYSWTGGATTASITNKPAGIYSVTITDASSCTATATTTISQPTSALAANIIGTNVNCFGGSDGAANLIVTGGTPSNTYSWSNSATTEDLTGLSIGTYSVTVTDANSCTANSSVTISQPVAALSASIVGTNLTCNASANGIADLSVSGGTAIYTYLWSNGATSEDLSGLSAGNNSVTVTDSKGCQTTASVTITEPIAISLVMSKTDVTCSGTSTGTATVTASGGTSPYNYLWTGGATTQTIVGKPAGTYFVTVTDVNSCSSVSSITIAQPSALTASISAQTNVLCNGGTNGSATVTATGGIAGYTYLWTGGATSASTSSLSAGTYTVTVTDANNCTTTATATITQPALALSASTTQINVSCFGGSNGSATVSVSGGTPSYIYLWSTGGTSATKNGLVAGTYTVTVTDNNLCNTTASVTITEPSVLSASTSKTDVTCNALCDGTASAIVSGGTTPYSYAWSGLQTSQSISSLCAGTFNLTVTDAKGCTANSNAVISEPSAIVITPSAIDATCGNADGSASVSVSGGLTPYGYLWSTGEIVNNISGKLAGSYGVTVNDANGCTNTASADINDSGAPTATASSTNVTCNGACDGTAQVTANGGTSPYTYDWSNTATTASVASLCNVTYSVTVTDDAGCKASASVIITQPSVLNASITSSSNVSCNAGNNGAATVSVSGGTTPYTYTWSNSASTANVSGLSAAVYSVTVLDSKSCSKIASVTITEPSVLTITPSSTDALCNGTSTGTANVIVSGGTSSYSYNWTSGGSTASESNLAVGSYTVTVTDANSCTNTASVTINEPSALTAGVVSSNVSCNSINDGSVSLTVSGGTIAYSFLWSNSATTEDISGLSANSYSVTITDANGCQTNASANITEPLSLSTNFTVTNVNCNGNASGAVNVTVTGGTTAYSYLWDNSEITEDLNNVIAGTYNLQITDANGCQASVNAIVTEPSALALIPSSSDATCGASNGSASVSVSGGNLPYTYLWSTSATSNSLSNVSAGSYDVTVSDGNSCTASTSIIINNAGAPTVSVTSVNDVSCFAGANGDATINVTGGVTPYIYSWSNGAASASITGLVANSYTVTVTDAMGCTSLANLTVTEPLELTASVVGTDVSCFGLSDGNVDLTVAGGTTTYSYNWIGGITTEDLTGIIAGTYDVTVTDANVCSATASITINEPFELTLSHIVTNENLGSDGAINLTVNGGTSGYTFNWSNSET